MAITSYYSTGVIEYIPAFGKNREISEKQTVISIKPMKSSEYRRYIMEASNLTMSVTKDKRFNVDNMSPEALEKARNEALKKSIVSIENFYIYDIATDNEKQIKSVDLLLEYAPDELLEELMIAAVDISTLKKGLKKTLNSQ